MGKRAKKMKQKPAKGRENKRERKREVKVKVIFKVKDWHPGSSKSDIGKNTRREKNLPQDVIVCFNILKLSTFWTVPLRLSLSLPFNMSLWSLKWPSQLYNDWRKEWDRRRRRRRRRGRKKEKEKMKEKIATS